jgi:hypothetical protein
MEKFRKVGVELLALLWDKELALEDNTELKKFLDVINNNVAARGLVTKQKKRLDGPLTRYDRSSAKAFAKHIYKVKEEDAAHLGAKRRYLQQLNHRPFSIIAVLFTGDDLLKSSLPVIEALSEGAERFADWLHWPKDRELTDSLNQYRPVASVVASHVASEAVQPSPIYSPRRTELRTECAYEQATRK